ncbi:hypothetical protein NL676_010920 [Syzygium grande]|nr:hypothetical protein NL676_010920 [Syzygium grande]
MGSPSLDDLRSGSPAGPARRPQVGSLATRELDDPVSSAHGRFVGAGMRSLALYEVAGLGFYGGWWWTTVILGFRL